MEFLLLWLFHNIESVYCECYFTTTRVFHLPSQMSLLINLQYNSTQGHLTQWRDGLTLL